MEQITEQYRNLLPESVILGMGDLTDTLTEEVLSEAELEEYHTFQNDRRRNEYLSSRYLIRYLAGEMGLDAAIFDIQKDGLGKPFGIHDNRRYNLSLAHADKKVACVLSESKQIGLDLEPVSRNVDERLRKRMLHPDEQKLLEGIPLIRIWTLKEAMVKLEGKGLRTNLNRIRIVQEGDSLFSGTFDDDKSAKICSFQHNHYWIALAHYI